jgi:hypothetical protein
MKKSEGPFIIRQFSLSLTLQSILIMTKPFKRVLYDNIKISHSFPAISRPQAIGDAFHVRDLFSNKNPNILPGKTCNQGYYLRDGNRNAAGGCTHPHS